MILLALLFGIFVAGFAANAAIAIRMQMAGNRGAAKTERLVWYGMLGSDWRRILRKHKELFPSSPLRRRYYLSAGSLVAAFLLIGIFAKVHKG